MAIDANILIFERTKEELKMGRTLFTAINSGFDRAFTSIFDSNVSEICAPSGSMYDPINGQFRFEHIINVLAGLYETDIESELTSIAKRVQKHTNKYSKRK